MSVHAPQGGTRAEVYVISDLHLGGQPAQGRRGFRLMTRPDRLAAFIRELAARPVALELVINGDFVDFLAERHEDAPHWRPLLEDQELALAIFRRIVSRPGDGEIFDALRALVAAGHQLTILLGNHDIELSFPKVREALLEMLGGPVSFIYDNEALVRGDAVIEHGNRYDRFNQVDHDGLRRLRSTMSRHLSAPTQPAFHPPLGSQMVAEVMNPIKETFPFVDLLKPETGAVIPTLLALNPNYRDRLVDVVKALGPSVRRGIDAQGNPRFAGDISSTRRQRSFAGDMGGPPPSARASEPDSESPQSLEVVLGERAAKELQRELFSSDISRGDDLSWFLQFCRLFTASGKAPVEHRLPLLLKALRTLWEDKSFSRDVETEKAYLTGANRLGDAGFRYIVFGHTHLPKHIRLEGGAEYLNSGTWADRVRLPPELFDRDEARALASLELFLRDIQSEELSRWIFREYTYVRLELERGGDAWRVRQASLEVWPEDGDGR